MSCSVIGLLTSPRHGPPAQFESPRITSEIMDRVSTDYAFFHVSWSSTLSCLLPSMLNVAVHREMVSLAYRSRFPEKAQKPQPGKLTLFIQ